jgi:hypothetical protein
MRIFSRADPIADEPEPEPPIEEPDLEAIVERPPELEEVISKLAEARAEKDRIYDEKRQLAPRLLRHDARDGDNRAAAADVHAKQLELDEVSQRIRDLRRRRAELMAPLSQEFAKATQPKTVALAEEAIASIESLQAGILSLRQIAVLGGGLHISLADQGIVNGYAMPLLMDASALDSFAASLTHMRRYFGTLAGRME